MPRDRVACAGIVPKTEPIIMNKKHLSKVQKRVAFESAPPAIICKPLQFIRSRTMVKTTNPATGHSHWSEGPEFTSARHAANRGNGAFVKQMARTLAAAA